MRGQELGCHWAHCVAQLGEFTGPVVGTRTGLHAHQARWEVGDELQQLRTRDFGPHQLGFAGFIHAVHGKDVLCQIQAYGYDCYELSLSNEYVDEKLDLSIVALCGQTLQPQRGAIGLGRGRPFHSLMVIFDASSIRAEWGCVRHGPFIRE